MTKLYDWWLSWPAILWAMSIILGTFALVGVYMVVLYNIIVACINMGVGA